MGITIFLADDHAVVRDGLRLLLETQPDFMVVGEAADGREAVRQITQHCPDIVLLDILMPGLNGLEAARQILQVCPTTHILILSTYTSSNYMSQALQAGVRGYLPKTSTGGELVEAIRAVHAGQRYFSDKVVDMIVNTYLSKAEAQEPPKLLDQLSSREREILQLVVEGKSSVEIGRILFLSPGSVDTYRSRLMHKLGVSDIPALVKFAIQHNIITLE